eukprot:scaffold107675_cov24-Tisochrysis_lutea.AAC.2
MPAVVSDDTLPKELKLHGARSLQLGLLVSTPCPHPNSVLESLPAVEPPTASSAAPSSRRDTRRVPCRPMAVPPHPLAGRNSRADTARSLLSSQHSANLTDYSHSHCRRPPRRN